MVNTAADMRIVQTNPDVIEKRAAPRFTLLIRAARLVSSQGEFVCVIRDVSETGVSVRLFHALPEEEQLELHMPGGSRYEIRTVWVRGTEAGFEFAQPVEVSRLIDEASEHPLRGLRLGVKFPVSVRTRERECDATIENFSQQGACFQCDCRLAIDQTLIVSSSEHFNEVRAKVRWRRDSSYGVVFDDTFSLAEFACLVARLQSPNLLQG